jgi:outer membrane biosynthesis protein TonB
MSRVLALFYTVPEEYRQPLFAAEIDPVYKRFLYGSSILGVVFLLVVLIVPQRTHVITDVSQVPERFARLILEEPTPPAPPPRAVRAQPEETPVVPPPPQTRARREPRVAPDQGKTGRALAREEITRSVADAASTAEKALESLSSSLGKNTTSTTGAKRSRRRSLSRGRSAAQAGSVGERGGQGRADVSGSALSGSRLAVESVTTVNDDAGTGKSGGSSTSASGGSTSHRSNAALLAVVRRYAPGIEFCYDNELKRSPGLRGKLVAAITVAASGKVTEVRLVQDTVKSSRLAGCMLAQIREWKFPAVSSGSTTFRTPFVFTPPKE